MVRLLIVVVPATVTASTKFLIQLKLVPVLVGIAIGVVEVALSARFQTIPPSAFAQETDAPVPIWPCTVAALTGAPP
jgi:hypothetical protein